MYAMLRNWNPPLTDLMLPVLWRQVVADPEKLQFYDVWVARDAEGKPLSNTAPYVNQGYSLERLRRGLPFPVSCCWNGMLSINAEPFRLGYEFR